MKEQTITPMQAVIANVGKDGRTVTPYDAPRTRWSFPQSTWLKKKLRELREGEDESNE